MWRWIDHTSELELEVRAATEEAVFLEGASAMADLLGDAGEDGPPRVQRDVALAGADRAVLFADWLGELAFLAETEGFVVGHVDRLHLGAAALDAVLAGRHGAPPHLVKAVTLHRLEFAHDGDGWRARAVLDV